METTKKSIERVGILTGLVTSLFLIGYFLLMKALDLAHISQLRYFNFFILVAGIIYAYNRYRTPNHNIPYLPGIGLGIITTAVSVFPFAFFMYVYFTFLDPGFLEVLKQSGSVEIAKEYLSPFAVTGAIIAEGLASGFILSFAFMQYYKSGFERHEKGKWWIYNS